MFASLVSRHLAPLLKFSIVGTIGLLVDVTALYLLLYLVGFGPYAGRLGSFLIAATTTWFINRVFTFRDARPESHGRQWLRFVVTNSLGAVINYAVYAAVISQGAASVYLPGFAVAAGSLAGLAFNYTLSRRYVFSMDEGSGGAGKA